MYICVSFTCVNCNCLDDVGGNAKQKDSCNEAAFLKFNSVGTRMHTVCALKLLLF